MSLASVFTGFNTHQSPQLPRYDARAPGTKADSGQAEVALNNAKSSELTYKAKSPALDTPMPGSETRTQAANNILSFVSARLRLDVVEGATKEELSSRLEAGLSGFIQGFQEAYDQLSGMGFLYPEVESAIEDTFSGVLDGIDELAEELGIASPVTDEQRAAQTSRRDSFVPAEPPVSAQALQDNAQKVADLASESAPIESKIIQSTMPAPAETPEPISVEAANLKSLIEASSFDYRAQESRSFNFSLKTQDGDSVVIKAAYASSALLEGESVKYGFAEGERYSGAFKVSSGFYLDVQGELDDQELLAIEDLLTHVREVSDMFFAGDVEAAFEKALDMGFNSEEIAEFSLRLRYQASVRYEEQTNSYAAQQPLITDEVEKLRALGGKDENLMTLARFVQALEDMRLKAEDIGFEGFRAEKAPDHLDKAESAKPVGIVSELLARLEALAQAE